MYFIDRGIEELTPRRGKERVNLEWLGERLRLVVDCHSDFDVPIDRFATWLVRGDDED